MSLREELGDFNSIVCFKAVVTGVEETLGKATAAVALIAAGRKRGRNLVRELGMSGEGADLAKAGERLSEALGANGTRLCKVGPITEEGENIRVVVSETVCMAGEPQGTDRTCTFTLGAVHGALEELTGRKLKGVHKESRWRGADDDVFEFRPRI
ncbi:MAG: hydrocarbon-binding protein [Myxococcota bacterium]